MDNQIIDWESRGNVVRFYLGENGKQWGDDWNDVPFEHNAGMVYSEFIKNTKDVSFPFDDALYFADNGFLNSPFSKRDFIERRVPFLVVVPQECRLYDDYFFLEFRDLMANNFYGCKSYYFGDEVE